MYGYAIGWHGTTAASPPICLPPPPPMRVTPFGATAYLSPAASSPVESWTTVMMARGSPVPSARAALRRGTAHSGGGVAATATGRRTDGEPNADRGWTVFQIPSAPGPFEPSDGACTVQIMRDFNSQGLGLGRPRQWPGSARESWGGGVAPHRRPDGMAAELSLGGECRPIDDAAGLTASLALVKASTWALARRWPAGRLRADRRRCTRKPPPRLPRAAT